MRAFVLGVLSPYVAALAYNLVWHDKLHLFPTAILVRFILVTCVIPVVMAIGAMMLVHRVWPRRILDPGANGMVRSLILGTSAGLGGLVIAAAGPPIAEGIADRVWQKAEVVERQLGVLIWHSYCLPDGEISDMVKGGTGGLLASAVLLLAFGGRRRTGLCLNCDYDVRASLNAGRCPECGMAI